MSEVKVVRGLSDSIRDVVQNRVNAQTKRFFHQDHSQEDMNLYVADELHRYFVQHLLNFLNALESHMPVEFLVSFRYDGQDAFMKVYDDPTAVIAKLLAPHLFE